ncbi:MAG: hypothetical protein ACYDAL_16805 [Candidatus Dormibacteraceae bacterium]
MDARRFSAYAGIAWVAVTAVGVAAFALAGTPPAFADGAGYAAFISRSSALFLTDAFAGGLGATLLIAFVVGLATTVRAVDARARLAATLLFGFGITVAGMLAIVATIETATVYIATTPAHAALTAPFFLATQTAVVFLYFPAVGFFVTLASSSSRLGFLPQWVARLSWIAAGLLAVATFATFGGTGPWGPLGLLQVLLGFLPAAITFLAVSISMARTPAS